MKVTLLPAFYGKTPHQIPCRLFIVDELYIGTWYVIEGSKNVHYTLTGLHKGINVEEILDTDGFTTDQPITAARQFIFELQKKLGSYMVRPAMQGKVFDNDVKE
nr:hypothetical protein [Endozoicomonas sp.]